MWLFFFQAEDGVRYLVRSRGVGEVYKRQAYALTVRGKDQFNGIDSFNNDKPYTRFVAEQIAGDLLPAKSDAEKQQNIIGTGFLTLGCVDLTALQYEQFIMDRVDDQIDVTTRAFLGMTIACARCHDHKTDPVSQHDYLSLIHISEPTRPY